jgi:hypothetical protein
LTGDRPERLGGGESVWMSSISLLPNSQMRQGTRRAALMGIYWLGPIHQPPLQAFSSGVSNGGVDSCERPSESAGCHPLDVTLSLHPVTGLQNRSSFELILILNPHRFGSGTSRLTRMYNLMEARARFMSLMLTMATMMVHRENPSLRMIDYDN